MTQGFLRTIMKLFAGIFVILPLTIATIGLIIYLGIIIYVYLGIIALAIAVILFIRSIIKNRKRR